MYFCYSLSSSLFWPQFITVSDILLLPFCFPYKVRLSGSVSYYICIATAETSTVLDYHITQSDIHISTKQEGTYLASVSFFFKSAIEQEHDV